MAAHCRSGAGPALIEAKTYRMRGHGEHDRQHYVDRQELEAWAKRCPVRCLREKLLKESLATEDELLAIEQQGQARVDAAVAFGDAQADRWDYVVLVYYPSRAAFLDMMGSAEYAAANVHREQAVKRHVILASTETYSKMAH